MKEVSFRWIDRYLIHLNFQQKFYLLLTLPIIGILVTAYILFSAASYQRDALVTSQIDTIATVFEVQQTTEQEARQLLSSSAVSVGPGENQRAVNGFYISSQPTSHLLGYLKTSSMIISLLTLCMIFLILYYIMTFIGGAMYVTHQALQRLVDGDLVSRLNFIPVNDEFSTIAVTIDRVAEREQKLVQASQKTTALIQQLSSQLKQNSLNSEQMTDTQCQHLDSLGSASEEMASSIHQVAQHASTTSTDTKAAHEMTVSGRNKVGETQSAIQQLSSDINLASRAVTNLDQNASRIDEVVATINGISEQTNLLALNAAIEAARAGEQGRGFAVVADEVRTLAGRTQDATVEIQQMIEALQNDSKSLLAVMDKTVQCAEGSESLISAVGQEISDIAEKNQYIADRSIEIATAAKQQGTVADDIASSVEQVKQQATHIGALIAASSQEIEQLNQQAEGLESLMAPLRV
ncbi:methyl-accepting chemotaxis protein [Thaumasiovibrio sp. DFM-14]|uniref:methyl-accepting chemotaxis protein n=1 Tax=Thaumasiovibrio sp. DFM-14 TaxID=3384792 RepID=UPI0039A2E4A0